MEQIKDIRLNADRRKAFIKDFRKYLEDKDSYLREQFYQAREASTSLTKTAFKTVKKAVRRKFPQEDVDTLRELSKKYDCMDSVANPDSCFYMKVTSKPIKYDSDGYEILVSDEEQEKVQEHHFDFKLDGNTTGSEYNHKKEYGYAMYREEMKANGLDPDCNVWHKDNQSNPHLSICQNANDKFLGGDNSGIGGNWTEKYAIDVIGSGSCRSRAIPCTQQEFDQMNIWLVAKAKVIDTHEKWITSVVKRVKFFEDQVKKMTHLSKVREFAKGYGWTPDETLLSKSGTDLSISTESMIDIMNTLEGKAPETREEKIQSRLLYQQSQGKVTDK